MFEGTLFDTTHPDRDDKPIWSAINSNLSDLVSAGVARLILGQLPSIDSEHSTVKVTFESTGFTANGIDFKLKRDIGTHYRVHYHLLRIVVVSDATGSAPKSSPKVGDVKLTEAKGEANLK